MARIDLADLADPNSPNYDPVSGRRLDVTAWPRLEDYMNTSTANGQQAVDGDTTAAAAAAAFHASLDERPEDPARVPPYVEQHPEFAGEVAGEFDPTAGQPPARPIDVAGGASQEQRDRHAEATMLDRLVRLLDHLVARSGSASHAQVRQREALRTASGMVRWVGASLDQAQLSLLAADDALAAGDPFLVDADQVPVGMSLGLSR